MSEERPIVINDLLSFLSCKIKLFSKKDLLKSIKSFYLKEDIDEALNRFIEAFPAKQQLLYKKEAIRGRCDSLLILYNLLKRSLDENFPVIVCRDLNNIPRISCEDNLHLGDENHTDLMSEQKLIKAKLSEVAEVVYQMKNKINELMQIKKKSFCKKERKGIAYLQKLIDEEDENFEEDGLNEENEDEIYVTEKEEDTDIYLENKHNLKALKRRTLVNNGDSIRLHKNDEQSAHESEAEWDIDDRISIPKVIQINNEEYESTSEVNDSETETSSKVIEVDFLQKDDDAVSDNNGKNPFIDVEQVFNENVGRFSIYKCSLCSFSTNDSTAVEQHECLQIYAEPTIKVGNETASKSFKYFCLDCRFKCNSKLLYQRHSQLHPQIFNCPFCDEDGLKRDNWTIHVKACITRTNRKRLNHICQVCGIIYANSGALLVHKGFHDPTKPYECLKCRYRFYTEDMLNRHFKAHTIKGFKCPFCHFTNKNKTTLVTHIRCHTGEMPFACDYCEYRCSSQSAMTSHALCHTDKKTVRCDECHALFKSLHKLNAHKVTHMKHKIHKCPDCHKEFKTGWLMTIHHQRIHLNIRPFACTLCSYKARSLSALKNHVGTHSNEKKLKCYQCDFKTSIKSYLKRHINQSHPETVEGVAHEEMMMEEGTTSIPEAKY